MKKKGNARPTKTTSFIQTSTIVLIAFFSSFLSRALDTLGAPSTINFLHFATVPIAVVVALSSTKVKSSNQRTSIELLLLSILLFLGVILISALINDAGIINMLLSFLLWTEPFGLLLAILCLPTTGIIVNRLRTWITYAFFAHTLLAFFQHYVLHYYRLSGAQDNIQGIFYRSGAGHVVGASVALTFGLYYAFTAKTSPLWLRLGVVAATFWHMILADAKQVLLSMFVGGALLLLFKLNDLSKALQYIALGAIVCMFFCWGIENLSAFSAFKTWMRPEIYGADGEATLLKSATFRIVPQFYQSPLNWIFGLGPGHSVDRLGGWMIREYWNLLGPLGATTHQASIDVWLAVIESWLGDQSSMFSPLFGWAALWGDFGFVGLASYLFICFITYTRICLSDISKFMALTIFAVGWVFSQMQEPSYMMSMSMLIGLNWHEHISQRQHKQQPTEYNLQKRLSGA
ncbi:MAG: hypothetical protein AAFY72_12235 [Cyanobacteria bacterium J06649_4]